MWSFKWNMHGNAGDMAISKQRFETMEEAADAMMKWAMICAENDQLIVVQLTRI